MRVINDEMAMVEAPAVYRGYDDGAESGQANLTGVVVAREYKIAGSRSQVIDVVGCVGERDVEAVRVAIRLHLGAMSPGAFRPADDDPVPLDVETHGIIFDELNPRITNGGTDTFGSRPEIVVTQNGVSTQLADRSKDVA